MTQLSLFSADLDEPSVGDLGGLLAAHGQVARSGTGVKLSILLDALWRAEALREELSVRGIAADVTTPELDSAPPGTVLLGTERRPSLADLADGWSKGAVKSVPEALELTGGALRCWVLAAGRRDEARYELGLDPHATGTFAPLLDACRRAGLEGTIVGAATAHPVIRVTGRKRIRRLAELVGSPPPSAPRGSFPSHSG